VVRELEREHLPACARHGVSTLPWSPLAGGFLSGKYRKEAAPPAGSRLERWKERYQSFDRERNWRILTAVDAVAKAVGASASQVALAWTMRRPTVASVIFGARSLAQLEDNLAAAHLTLAPEHLEALEQASAFELGYPYDFMKRIQGTW
jgi:aryl-alcohol dehydrogenase-like predicted oxidoreductase